MLFCNKRAPAGLQHTEDRAGDAPKPQFSLNSIENQQKPNNQPPVNHKNYPLFLSLPIVLVDTDRGTHKWSMLLPALPRPPSAWA